MITCPSCSAELSEDSRFCSSCGAPALDASASPTRTSLRAVEDGSPVRVATPRDETARFVPGTVLARRYRMVGLLGRGGMGEVYRADDLKLGQPVALKFLPRALEGDPDRLERFLNEVKTARQVSHPNVCRVYDVGEM